MRTELDVKISSAKSITVYSTDDVEAVLERNKRLRSTEQKSDWGRHIATIPAIILVKWLNEEYCRGHDVRFLSPEYKEMVARKLRDPDWAFLRVDGPSHQMGWAK